MLHRYLPLAFSAPLTYAPTSTLITTSALALPNRHRVCTPCNKNTTSRSLYFPSSRHTATVVTASLGSSSPPPSSSSNTLRVLRDDVIETYSNVPDDGRNGGRRMVSVMLKTEDLGGRRRRISGCIDIPTSRARVWSVITAYEEMDKVLPNIVTSAVQRTKDSIVLDQIALISRKLRLKSRMALQVFEDPDTFSLHLKLIEGRDFEAMDATYRIQVLDDDDDESSSGSVEKHKDRVRLDYDVIAIPFPLYPMSLVENKVAKDVPKMLAAIRDEAVLGKHVPIS